MRGIASFSLAVTASLLLLLNSPGARAAELTTTETRACGTDAHEAIAAAERALASNDDERRALVCVVEVLKLLEAAEPITLRGHENHPVLRAPIWSPEK